MINVPINHSPLTHPVANSVCPAIKRNCRANPPTDPDARTDIGSLENAEASTRLEIRQKRQPVCNSVFKARTDIGSLEIAEAAARLEVRQKRQPVCNSAFKTQTDIGSLRLRKPSSGLKFAGSASPSAIANPKHEPISLDIIVDLVAQKSSIFSAA